MKNLFYVPQKTTEQNSQPNKEEKTNKIPESSFFSIKKDYNEETKQEGQQDK